MLKDINDCVDVIMAAIPRCHRHAAFEAVDRAMGSYQESNYGHSDLEAATSIYAGHLSRCVEERRYRHQYSANEDRTFEDVLEYLYKISSTNWHTAQIWSGRSRLPSFQIAPKVSAKTGCSASMAVNVSINETSRWSGIVGMRS